MNNNDNIFHNSHMSKKVKFNQAIPAQTENSPKQVPHRPKIGSNAKNNYR